jgi:DNA-directed RNA polymerase subunit RPC12/RpoP/uncharacterized protein YukE
MEGDEVGTQPEDAAARVAELSEQLERIHDLLEEAERAVASVRRDLSRLGVGDEWAKELERLVIPSDRAEQLMEGLDQLAGELANRAARTRDRERRGAGEAPGWLEEQSGLLRRGGTAAQRLMVSCVTCNRDFEAPVASELQDLPDVSIDQRTYRCPHCGEAATYETWDHFLD